MTINGDKDNISDLCNCIEIANHEICCHCKNINDTNLGCVLHLFH